MFNYTQNIIFRKHFNPLNDLIFFYAQFMSRERKWHIFKNSL